MEHTAKVTIPAASKTIRKNTRLFCGVKAMLQNGLDYPIVPDMSGIDRVQVKPPYLL